MDIYLIRHTKTSAQDGICYGQHDVDVAETFREELENVKGKIPRDYDLIICSPLQRCRKLAEALNGGSYQTDDRLKELSFGRWEMQEWNSIDREEMEQWSQDFVNNSAPGGESFQDLRNRVKPFLAELFEMKRSSIAVVSHAGVIRTVLAEVLGVPLKNIFNIGLDFGSVSLLSVKDKIRKVRYINR